MKSLFAYFIFLLFLTGCATDHRKDAISSYTDSPKWIGGGTELYLYADGKWDRWSSPIFHKDKRVERGEFDRIGKQKIVLTGSTDLSELYLFSRRGTTYLMTKAELKAAQANPSKLNSEEGYTFFDLSGKAPPKPPRDFPGPVILRSKTKEIQQVLPANPL